MDKKQRSASLHDIMDSETFLGPSIVPHQGVDNPLATIGMFSDFSGSDGDGTERASDVDMEEGRVRGIETQTTTHFIYALLSIASETELVPAVVLKARQELTCITIMFYDCIMHHTHMHCSVCVLTTFTNHPCYSQAGPTRSFNNPAYDLENRSRQQVIPPPMIAASSTDDIILLSKKNRGGVSPRHPMAQPAGKYNIM